VATQVEKAFQSEVDGIYGKKGFLFKTKGVDTPEWKFMKSLPAKKVVEYYSSDSANTTLSPEIAKELSQSPKHIKFFGQIKELMAESKGTIKPYDNEKIEPFLKRLGHFVMKEHLENSAKLSTLN
jgi:hypothetical protein